MSLRSSLRTFAVAFAAVGFTGLAIITGTTQAKENFFETYRERYLLPRAFPDSSITDSLRTRAFRAFVAARPPGVGHIETSWSDTALAGDPVTGPCVWRSIGPTNINGRVTGIAYDTGRPDRIFATTVGGIWRSVDAGRRWHRVSDNLAWANPADPSGVPPAVWACVAVNPLKPNEVLAGSGDPNYAVSLYAGGRDSSMGQGIWRSTNDGATWLKVSPPDLDREVIFRLRIASQEPNDVYAATSRGIWKGTHSASTMTWQRLGNLEAKCSDVLVDFTHSPRLVYAGAYEGTAAHARGVWKWDPSAPQTGTGDSWHARMGGIDDTDVGAIAMAMDPRDPDIVFAKIARASDGSHHGIYRARNATATTGPSWDTVVNGSPLDDSQFSNSPDSYCWYNNVIEVDPTNSMRMLAGGKLLYLSTDRGDHWTSVSLGGEPGYVALHDDQHAIAFHPTLPVAIVGNDGGLDRSTSLGETKWHWEHISHGMTTGQYYAVAAQQKNITVVAAGSQDNGSGVTFGNRTWYKIEDCDSWSIAVDAEDPCNLYETCNGEFRARVNPVAGTAASGAILHPVVPANVLLGPPYAADPTTTRHAISTARNTISKRQRVCRTADGVNWTELTQSTPSGIVPEGHVITCLAIDPASAFTRFFAGIRGPTSATIWRYESGAWNISANGLPTDKVANDVTFEGRTIPPRIYASLSGSAGGAVAMSTDGGAQWTVLGVQGVTALGPVMALALDPSSSSVVYAATMVGVLKGTVGVGGTSINWIPFDEGMPEGADVTDIWVNPTTAVLKIATMGYGIFERDIAVNRQCASASVLVRDNVFDRGQSPSPHGDPNPERPVPDGDFFRAAGNVNWWSSTDIRIELPEQSGPNAVPQPGVQASRPAGTRPLSVDHVEMESCPIENGLCPPGTVIDTAPMRGRTVRVHVQVTNQGHQPISNVRVLALWAEVGASLPLLPNDIWSTRFPAGSSTCPVWPPGGDWHAVDAMNPCQLIPSVNPDVPEVVTFEWDVPTNAAEHSCMVAIVESPNDALAPWVRSTNERRLWELVPKERHVGQRNLHLIDVPVSGALMVGTKTFKLWNPTPDSTGIDLVISRAGLPVGIELSVLLPVAAATNFAGVRPQPVLPRSRWVTQLRKRVGKSAVPYRVTARDSVFTNLKVPPGEAWTIGVHFGPKGRARLDVAPSFTVAARRGTTVLGGSTYILRLAPPAKKTTKAPARKSKLPTQGR